jgi:hypothetical protein
LSIDVRAPTLAVLLVAIYAVPACGDPAIDTLLEAYPAFLKGYQDNDLIWKDGARSPISDGEPNKPFDQLLKNPSIKDQFAIAYPLDPQLRPPRPNEDPGRIRNQAFFLKMYGDCRRGEVARRLKPVAWLPNRGGSTVMVTTINGVADQLALVVRALEALPESMTAYLVPSAGTYNCRHIAGTQQLSAHAFGAAIDLPTKYGDYWRWSPHRGGTIVWKNRIPAAIVQTFERHGFIWGGRWYHFDTLHFEYRPEIVALAKQGWPTD